MYVWRDEDFRREATFADYVVDPFVRASVKMWQYKLAKRLSLIWAIMAKAWKQII